MTDDARRPAYTCHRASGPIEIDGDLTKPAWADAPRTPRFGDAKTGQLTLFDTRAAMLWDDVCLYVAFWMEERDVWSTRVESSTFAQQDNAAAIYIAGSGAYYAMSVSPMNRTSELFVIWKDSYTHGGRYDVPEFDLAVHRPAVYGGDGGPHHPRGMRWAFFDWHFTGLETAVQIDGTLNQRTDIDRGWTVEMAFPWEGMARLSDGPAEPEDGRIWGISPVRYEVVDQRASRFTAQWSPYPADEHDLHVPDRYPQVAFSDKVVAPEGGADSDRS